MKKIVLLSLLFIMPLIVSSQEMLTYKSGGRVFNTENKKIKALDVRVMMASNPEALKLYNAGKAKQTWGNVFLYGGISTVVINHYLILQESNKGTVNAGRNIPYIIGAGMVLIAIPIKIGFSKKIKKAINLMNEESKNTSTGFNIETSSFIANTNGIGVSITF